MKKKIAIINQRYGKEVNGGSEVYTRLLAEHLSEHYDIEILTTTALNYDTWENYYPEGITIENGISVRRFRVNKIRRMKYFRIVNKLIRMLPYKVKVLEEWWAKEQGPFCPDFLSYLELHQKDYDIFIFVTYLYYLTLKGLPKVAERSILIPTAHDEPFLYFKIYTPIFKNVKAMIFLTEEEKGLIHRTFHNQEIKHEVIGIGVDSPDKIEKKKFLDKYGLEEFSYILYVGRVDVGKNCDEMFEYFFRYKEETKSDLKLVIMGKAQMEMPEDKEIHYLGFVSEEEKYAGIKGAKLLLLPSAYESLSIAVLEAMSLGTPVLVNGNCEVLKGHCEKSKGGFYYTDYKTFKTQLQKISLNDKKRDLLSENGKRYIKENYTWGSAIKKYRNLIEEVS